jgi:hypothetical protein
MKVNTFVSEDIGPARVKIIVIEKKTKHSKLARSVYKGNDYLSCSAHKMVNSMAEGISKFREKNKRSYRNNQDDFIVNFIPNMLNGLSVPTRQFGKIAVNFIRRVKI